MLECFIINLLSIQCLYKKLYIFFLSYWSKKLNNWQYLSIAIELPKLNSSQKLLFDLFPLIDQVSIQAMKSNIYDMKNKCVLADLASMKHETLKVRLFKS